MKAHSSLEDRVHNLQSKDPESIPGTRVRNKPYVTLGVGQQNKTKENSSVFILTIQ